MTLLEKTLENLVHHRDNILRQYRDYRYLSVSYNHRFRVRPLENDRTSRRLVLIDRGTKKIPACDLLKQTYEFFNGIPGIDNLFFSELGAGMKTNKLKLYHDDITRYVISLHTPGPCGWVIQDVDHRADQTAWLAWTGTKDFFCYNLSDLPRTVLVFDVWR